MEPAHDDRATPIARLLRGIDAAVTADDVRTITAQVKQELETFSRRPETGLPDALCRPLTDRYARRLLHRDPDSRYTAVIMTWGPRQQTQLHDHAGIWCVECVIDGELDVTQYDLVEQSGARCRFEQRQTLRAGVGEAGCLIPPFEYHVLGNPGAERPTITLHVYGGEMDQCNLYVADPDGWWQRQSLRLRYDG